MEHYVMNEIGIGAWQDDVVGQAKERFRLTAREAIVVQHLLKGWTNKEIAKEMGLAVQTIKQHFKHIFEKTRTTTRTGVIMQVVHCRVSDEPPTSLANSFGPATPSRSFARHRRDGLALWKDSTVQLMYEPFWEEKP